MASYMPEVEGEKTGVYESLINTFSADTLEELGEKLGLTDVQGEGAGSFYLLATARPTT